LQHAIAEIVQWNCIYKVFLWDIFENETKFRYIHFFAWTFSRAYNCTAHLLTVCMFPALNTLKLYAEFCWIDNENVSPVARIVMFSIIRSNLIHCCVFVIGKNVVSFDNVMFIVLE
jgi:hypothetical protein